MKENTIHHANFLDNTMPDKCANLIIADPPYYKVKGEFDFVWKTFDDYLQDVEKWAKECKRILADNGTLFWWGDRKKIAYSQIILDNHFHLIDALVWEKPNSYTETYFKTLRSFISKGHERLLMYSTGKEPSEYDQTGWDKVKKDVSNFQPLRNYFQGLQGWINTPKKNIIDKIGQCADHCFRWGSTQWDLPTQETYAELMRVFSIKNWEGFREYEELRQEYEELRQEYEELRRPFNNHLRLSDVMKFSQEGHVSGNYDHDTIKPEKLTSALITTCSRPGDLVVVPFAGSGTECAMAAKNGRKFIGYDIEGKYVKMSQDRANVHLIQKKLFYVV